MSTDDIARVTVTLPALLVAEIGRFETNRSRFILEAVRRELRRRQRALIRRSLDAPHPEGAVLVEEGLADWAADLPAEDAAALLDRKAGRTVRWTPGEGFTEVRR